MLHWIYIAIVFVVAALIGVELFHEKRWRNQIALAILLIPLILRLLHIK
jgi:hypothetical protein